MKIQQIRNATIVIEYEGKKLIVDPWFQKKGCGMSAPCPDPEMRKMPSPMVELPMPVSEIMINVDAIIVTHIHPDHFDPETAAMLDKSIPVYTQDEETKLQIEEMGYQTVIVLSAEGTNLENITMFSTEAMHGEAPECTVGNVCGVVLSAPTEKTLYIAGDTIFYTGVVDAITKYHPDIIVVNACGATLLNMGRLIMDEKDVLAVCEIAPHATIIASHMEAVNHATVTRNGLHSCLKKYGVDQQVLIPADGEEIVF